MEKINGDWSVTEKLQLKEGHYYKRRDGEIVGPATRNSDSIYAFYVAARTCALSYASNGVYDPLKVFEDDKSYLDLIEDLGPVDHRTVEPQKISQEKLQIASCRDPAEVERVALARKALFDSLNESANKAPNKPKKRPLAVGDRVLVYSALHDGTRAKVLELNNDALGAVKVEIDGETKWFHEKQCRRLVKKQKVTNVFSGKTDAEIAEQIKMSMRISGLCGPESLAGNAFLKHLGLGE